MHDYIDKGRSIAYFSMEIGLESGLPSYSGGLGMLAGDTIRSAADLEVPMVAVTLLYRKGYFFQKLDREAGQIEEPQKWNIEDFLIETDIRTTVTIEGRPVSLRVWRYYVSGTNGFRIPVYFLDAQLQENTEYDQTLTDHLYGGDRRYRFCQEVILGIGGVRALRQLGYNQLTRFHMNEGHSALLTIELLDERLKSENKSYISNDDVIDVRNKCVFTTHTPVPAGHDKFPMDMVKAIFGHHQVFKVQEIFHNDESLNMTLLALNFSNYINGVAKKHGQVSQTMFTDFRIDAITNGVHVSTWSNKAFQDLFDQYIPGWRDDNFSLRGALNIPKEKLWEAHLAAKRDLVNYVNWSTNAGYDVDKFTIGFARRVTPYKRPSLIFSDIQRLMSIAKEVGPIQIVFAGKAHPNDQGGKDSIRKILAIRDELKEDLRLVFLPNYDMNMGKLITNGVDLWLNTPEPPLEASGTSGMKAAANGVPSLSTMDGWWIEGWIPGVTGWAIGESKGGKDEIVISDSQSLYEKLENPIIPMYYNERDQWIDIMRHTIALNSSFFNTQRMVQQYVVKAYYGYTNYQKVCPIFTT